VFAYFIEHRIFILRHFIKTGTTRCTTHLLNQLDN